MLSRFWKSLSLCILHDNDGRVVLILSLCISPLLKTDGHLSSSAPIVVTVLIIILLSIVAGVLFVKKYVCGGRSVQQLLF